MSHPSSSSLFKLYKVCVCCFCMFCFCFFFFFIFFHFPYLVDSVCPSSTFPIPNTLRGFPILSVSITSCCRAGTPAPVLYCENGKTCSLVGVSTFNIILVKNYSKTSKFCWLHVGNNLYKELLKQNLNSIKATF